MDRGGTWTFYEFFAGGGMARAGLGPNWRCLFANDIDKKKAESYQANWGRTALVVKDVADVRPEELPGQADLAWASFPCQDLSFAGNYAGLAGERSGTFWPFWHLMCELDEAGRAPRLIVLENVYGALTSHGGADFSSIATAIAGAGYRFGALIMDARAFVPQSRARLSIIASRSREKLSVRGPGPQAAWHPSAVGEAYRRLPKKAQSRWVWWSPPLPTQRTQTLADLIEDDPRGVTWHSSAETDYILSLMSPLNRQKLIEVIELTRSSGELIVCGVYRRTREGRGTWRKLKNFGWTA
jgi:DNA (cytosine-5)-methyltransferase 1